MDDTHSRRDFLKAGVSTVFLAGSQSQATPAASAVKSVLEPFNYTGVRLRDGMLRDQFLHARNLYLNISDDSLLLGYRQRAGLPAPGVPLTGWYGGY